MQIEPPPTVEMRALPPVPPAPPETPAGHWRAYTALAVAALLALLLVVWLGLQVGDAMTPEIAR